MHVAVGIDAFVVLFGGYVQLGLRRLAFLQPDTNHDNRIWQLRPANCWRQSVHGVLCTGWDSGLPQLPPAVRKVHLYGNRNS